MRAYLIFTGGGPVLALSTFPKLTDARLLEKLRYKGIERFLAYEVALPIVRERYEHTFPRVAAELEGSVDMRILDFNGHQIMANFSLEQLGDPIKFGT